jgi:hypothetical protein
MGHGHQRGARVGTTDARRIGLVLADQGNVLEFGLHLQITSLK